MKNTFSMTGGKGWLACGPSRYPRRVTADCGTLTIVCHKDNDDWPKNQLPAELEEQPEAAARKKEIIAEKTKKTGAFGGTCTG